MRQLVRDFASLHGQGKALHIASDYDPGEGKRIEFLGLRADGYYVVECLGRRTPREWLTHVLVQAQLLFEQALDGTLDRAIAEKLKLPDVARSKIPKQKPNSVKRRRIRFVVLADKFSPEFLNLAAALNDHYQLPVECYVPCERKRQSRVFYEFCKASAKPESTRTSLLAQKASWEKESETDEDASIVQAISVHPSGFIEEIWDESEKVPGYSENDVEEWLASKMSEPEGEITCLARQLKLGTTANMVRLDLLALDKEARFHLLELKRGRADIRVFAQLLDYASRFHGPWSDEDLDSLGQSPDEVFCARFQKDPPAEGMLSWPAMDIVAADYPEEMLRLAVYLNHVHAARLSLFRFEAEQVKKGDHRFCLHRVVRPETALEIGGVEADVWVVRWEEKEGLIWDEWMADSPDLPMATKDWLQIKNASSNKEIHLLIYLSGCGYVGFTAIQTNRPMPPAHSRGVRCVPASWVFRLEREKAVFRRHFPQPDLGLEVFENGESLPLILGQLWSNQHRMRESSELRFGSDRRLLPKSQVR